MSDEICVFDQIFIGEIKCAAIVLPVPQGYGSKHALDASPVLEAGKRQRADQ